MAISSYGDPNFFLNQPSFLDFVTGNPWSQQQAYNILQPPQLPGGMPTAQQPTMPSQPGQMMPQMMGTPSSTGSPTMGNVVPMSDWLFFGGVPGFQNKFMNPQQAQQATLSQTTGTSGGSPLAPGSGQSIQWPSVSTNPNYNPNDPDPVHQALWGPGSGVSMATTSLPSSIPSGVAKWKDLIEKVATQVGIKPSQIAAIVQHESGGDPNAQSIPTPWGKAQGLMQVMGFNAQPGDNLLDPLTNLTRGAQLFKKDLNQWGGDQSKAAAAYYGAIDANGNPNNASDGSGVTGIQFVQQFNALQHQMEPFDQLVGAISQYVPQLQQALASARGFVGQPYVWGGADPKTGFDCSGLTQWVYGQHGIQLPRTAQLQYNVAQKINPSQTQPGDLIFFQGTYPTTDTITHVGLYVGNGQMLSASQNGIGYQSLNDPFWSAHFAGVGHITPGGH